ncbi:hypothetical protein K493DRAFT_95556 [Basidiobolus meristosporus CBS 931.73]|uniref:PHD-type domain-containing protein n=1 Tax=Basidiobolus meristosporus CBS 931.73 TaxID=1314790 RepID=A0A1Y1YU11_9FUNG|nr:hypothetical protein K493DRAFT_95556 [Basidiobolus meristosporus CBS 931.73]|eukprot:ORY01314.1 hypothetical protein K493DRAFT_95556 [Basidiobolus meristosporus CBS 931.73]
MFSMEVAKLLGFRDSHSFFNKNPNLERLWATESERRHLVEQGLLVPMLKSRPIAFITAHSAFKNFGAKVVKNGRRGVDDYYEAEAIAFGFYEEVREEEPRPMFHAASSIPTSNDASSGLPEGVGALSHVNATNWMYVCASSTRSFNSMLAQRRKANSGFFDVHTNLEQVPSATQSQEVWVEKLDDAKVRNGTHIEPVIKFRAKNLVSHPDQLPDKELLDLLPSDMAEEALRLIESQKEEVEGGERKYPIALINGQYQATYPIHRTRLNQVLPKSSAQDGPYSVQAMYPSLFTPAQGTPQSKQLATPTLPQSHQTLASPPVNPVPKHSPAPEAAGGSLKPTAAFTCGIIASSTGQPCKRLVTFDGERCLYHKSILALNMANNSRATSEVSQPQTPSRTSKEDEDEDDEEDAEIESEGSPRQTISTVPPNACVHCHSLLTPSALVTKDSALPFSLLEMLTCARCDGKHHPLCIHLNTTRLIDACRSYPWECNDCKICVVCESTGDEETLLICDDCDRAWHMTCCIPPVKELPKDKWLCPLCARCQTCGPKPDTPPSDFQHALAPPYGEKKYPTYLATYCAGCYGDFQANRYCPCCMRTFTEDAEEEMVCCDQCDRWIHRICDSSLTKEKYQNLAEDETMKYLCPFCEKNPPEDVAEIVKLDQNPVAVPYITGAGKEYFYGDGTPKGES